MFDEHKIIIKEIKKEQERINELISNVQNYINSIEEYLKNINAIDFPIHNSYKIYYKKQQLKVLKKSEEDIALKELESSQKLMQLNNEKLKLDIESKNLSRSGKK